MLSYIYSSTGYCKATHTHTHLHSNRFRIPPAYQSPQTFKKRRLTQSQHCQFQSSTYFSANKATFKTFERRIHTESTCTTQRGETKACTASTSHGHMYVYIYMSRDMYAYLGTYVMFVDVSLREHSYLGVLLLRVKTPSSTNSLLSWSHQERYLQGY